MSSNQAAQQALLAEVTKKDFELKHVEPPGESVSTAQAKLLLEVKGGKRELHHVDSRPKEGLTEAEKQAYLEEKRQATQQ